MEQESNKQDLREEIQRQVENFIDQGGEVESVARGASGRDPSAPPLRHLRSFEQRPKEPRTPVPEVVAAIELRRQQARKPVTRPKREKRRKPVRRLVYDEFGEPLRYEWRDE